MILHLTSHHARTVRVAVIGAILAALALWVMFHRAEFSGALVFGGPSVKPDEEPQHFNDSRKFFWWAVALLIGLGFWFGVAVWIGR